MCTQSFYALGHFDPKNFPSTKNVSTKTRKNADLVEYDLKNASGQIDPRSAYRMCTLKKLIFSIIGKTEPTTRLSSSRKTWKSMKNMNIKKLNYFLSFSCFSAVAAFILCNKFGVKRLWEFFRDWAAQNGPLMFILIFQIFTRYRGDNFPFGSQITGCDKSVSHGGVDNISRNRTEFDSDDRWTVSIEDVYFIYTFSDRINRAGAIGRSCSDF